MIAVNGEGADMPSAAVYPYLRYAMPLPLRGRVTGRTLAAWSRLANLDVERRIVPRNARMICSTIPACCPSLRGRVRGGQPRMIFRRGSSLTIGPSAPAGKGGGGHVPH